MKLIAILSSILLSAQGSVLNRVDDVRVRVHVASPTGPVADVQIGVISECAPDAESAITYARTNAAGVADFVWHRCDRNVIQVLTASRLIHSAAPVSAAARAAELDRLEAMGTAPYVKRVKIDPEAQELTIEFPAPGGRNIVFQLTGSTSSAMSAYLFSDEMRMPVPHGVHPTAHTFTVRGIRKGESHSAFLSISNLNDSSSDLDDCSRAIPVEIPAGDDDASVAVNVPEWTPNANIDMTVNRVFTSAQRPAATYGRFMYAFETLISADGSVIIGFGRTQNVSEQGHGLNNDRFKRRIPAGTYYYAPGMFTMGGAGPRLLERIKAGEDLTNSGIPKFTVAEGETATLSVSWLDAWKAIFKLP